MVLTKIPAEVRSVAFTIRVLVVIAFIPVSIALPAVLAVSMKLNVPFTPVEPDTVAGTESVK